MIERADDGWLITPTDMDRIHEVGPTQLVTVEYPDPHTGGDHNLVWDVNILLKTSGLE